MSAKGRSFEFLAAFASLGVQRDVHRVCLLGAATTTPTNYVVVPGLELHVVDLAPPAVMVDADVSVAFTGSGIAAGDRIAFVPFVEGAENLPCAAAVADMSGTLAEGSVDIHPHVLGTHRVCHADPARSLCCFLCLLCLLFWLCCGKPGKEKLYVYQVPALPMKQVEVAFRA